MGTKRDMSGQIGKRPHLGSNPYFALLNDSFKSYASKLLGSDFPRDLLPGRERGRWDFL